MNNRNNISSRLFLALSLTTFPLLSLAQVAEQVPIDVGSSVQVGRPRMPFDHTVGLHNLVHVVQRRPAGMCDSRFAAQESSRLETADRADSALAIVHTVKTYPSLLRKVTRQPVFVDQKLEYPELPEPSASQSLSPCWTTVASEYSWNLVTNAGLNWLADIMSNTSTPAVNTQCNFIGLTNTAITPGATDTTLSGEIVANGLTRAQGTYAHTANATTYTVAHTFTATATQSAQAGAVFTAISTGTMCFEDTFTSATLATNDTLTVTWTVTI